VQRMDGTWGGLVHCNSLHTKAEYIEYLRREISKREATAKALANRTSADTKLA